MLTGETTKSRAMPPKLDDKATTERLQLVTTSAWLARVDEWRRKQPDIPNKSEAIRRLVEHALDADDKRKR